MDAPEKKPRTSRKGRAFNGPEVRKADPETEFLRNAREYARLKEQHDNIGALLTDIEGTASAKKVGSSSEKKLHEIEGRMEQLAGVYDTHGGEFAEQASRIGMMEKDAKTLSESERFDVQKQVQRMSERFVTDIAVEAKAKADFAAITDAEIEKAMETAGVIEDAEVELSTGDIEVVESKKVLPPPVPKRASKKKTPAAASRLARDLSELDTADSLTKELTESAAADNLDALPETTNAGLSEADLVPMDAADRSARSEHGSDDVAFALRDMQEAAKNDAEIEKAKAHLRSLVEDVPVAEEGADTLSAREFPGARKERRVPERARSNEPYARIGVDAGVKVATREMTPGTPEHSLEELRNELRAVTDRIKKDFGVDPAGGHGIVSGFKTVWKMFRNKELSGAMDEYNELVHRIDEVENGSEPFDPASL